MSLLSWVEKACRGVETYSKYALLGLVQQAKLNKVLKDSASVLSFFLYADIKCFLKSVYRFILFYLAEIKSN